MTDLSLRRLAVVSITILLLITGSMTAARTGRAESETATEFQAAPLNPKFVEFMLNRDQIRLKTNDGYSLGYIPPHLDLSSINRGPLVSPGEASSAAYPSKYDLRSLHRVTPVRDQGACGACWAFGSMASLESCLLKSGQTWDFSEGDMNQNHGFDFRVCNGGYAEMAVAYLARWSGPLAEATYPYPFSDSTAPQATTGTSVKKHLQDVIYLPQRDGFLDNDTIKWALINYGAVTVTYYADNKYLNTNTWAFYCTDQNEINHLVAIVGWDDNFSKSNFKIAPPGDGAFIVKNSWGTGFADKGYFYISYYDASLKMGHVFNGVQSTNNYDIVYQYDPLGWITSIGSSHTAWMGNVFTAAKGASNIKAISFYTPEKNCEYSIYIYDNVKIKYSKLSGNSPTNGKRVYSLVSQLMPYPGYHTVRLPKAVRVTPLKRFSIVVRLTTPTSTTPIPVECPVRLGASVTLFASGANATNGQSFVKLKPTAKAWKDLTTLTDSSDLLDFAKANACLKAFGSK